MIHPVKPSTQNPLDIQEEDVYGDYYSDLHAAMIHQPAIEPSTWNSLDVQAEDASLN